MNNWMELPPAELAAMGTRDAGRVPSPVIPGARVPGCPPDRKGTPLIRLETAREVLKIIALVLAIIIAAVVLLAVTGELAVRTVGVP